MEPYIAEIRIFAFNQIPRGWAPCNGSLLAINQNAALFSLIGTQFGGNGTTNFALPDLRGRVPMGAGPSNMQGAPGGTTTTTLNIGNLPMHNHLMQASTTAASQLSPEANYFAASADNEYATGPMAPMAAGMLSNTGGNVPVSNVQPYLATTFAIAIQGIFPSRS